MTAPVLDLSYSSAQNAPATVLQLASKQSVSKDGFVNFPATTLTLSLWLKTESAAAGAVLVAYDADGQDTSHQIVLRNPAGLEIVLGDTPALATGIAINTGQWTQVALVIAPHQGSHTAVTLYIDGAVRFSAAGAVPKMAFESAGTLVLGRTAVDGDAQSLAGLFSEFRLWNGARTAGQIVTDMMVRAATLTPPPLECWPLDQAPPDATVTGDPEFVSSILRFRVQTLTASWSQVSGADSYNLYVQDLAGCWRPETKGLTGSSTTLTDYTVNAASQGAVQAVTGSQPGEWSEIVRADLLNLSALTPMLRADLPAVTLGVAWTAVDQAPKTRYATYQDGAGAPTLQELDTTQADLTALMKDADHWWTYTLGADSSAGSLGPVSDIKPSAQPDLTFRFQNDASNVGALEVSWAKVDGAAYLYVRVDRTSATPGLVSEQMLDGAATSAALNPTLTDGEALNARVRGLALGTVGRWATAKTLTVHRFPPPYISAATGDGDAHTIEVRWAIDSQNPGLTFLLQLYDAAGQTLIKQDTATASPYTFTDSQIVNGQSYKVRIQATLDNSYSLWSAWRDVSVAALPAVTLNAPTVNNDNDITVAWARPAGLPDDAQYVVSINSPTPQTQTLDATKTTTTFKQSDTKVERDKTYTIAMHAERTTQNGPVTTVEVQTKPTPENPGDNPHSDDKDDPINTSDGSYRYSQKLLSLPNPVPLEFGVFYATTRPTHGENPLVPDSVLGPRWSHVYETRLVADTQTQRLAVMWGDGPINVYAIPLSVLGPYSKLGVQNGDSLNFGEDGLYRLRRKDQSVFSFDSSGVLQRVQSPAGNTLHLAYDGQGRLHTVSDPNTDKSLTFAYYGSGLLQTVTDNGRRSVSFGYDSTSLTRITNAGGGERTIVYTGDALIETVTDENQDLLFKNTFETVLGSPRVTFQQDGRAVANGESYGSSFTYRRESQADTDYVVCDYQDREGNAETYRAIEANGSTVESRSILSDGTVQHIASTYDGNANLLTRQVYRGPEADYAPGLGNLWSYTYDGARNLLTSTDPAKRMVTRTYDEKNRMTSVTDLLGNTTTYHYADDLLQWVEDFAGRRTTYEYEPGAIKGLLKTLTDSSGNAFGFTYNANGQAQTATDPFGNKRSFEYFDAGQIRQVTTQTAGGDTVLVQSFDYWGDGSVKTVRTRYAGQSDADAFVTDYARNPDGSVHTSTNAAGEMLTLGYDANALLSSVEYPDVESVARTLSFGYDRNDFPQSETLSAALGVESDLKFNQLGELQSVTDPERHEYAYSYATIRVTDTQYNIQTTETLPLLDGQPDAASQKWLSDPSGRPLSVTDAEGRTTTYAYSTVEDPQTHRRNLIVTATLPPVKPGDASYTRISEYDPVGRLVRLTDEAGKITQIAYTIVRNPDDKLYYRTVTRTDPAGRKTVITVDPLGRTASIKLGEDADAIVRSFEYDALGRLTRATESGPGGYPIVTGFTYGYAAADRVVTVALTRNENPEPIAIRHVDGLGRLVREIDPDGAIRSFAYCAWGGLSSFTEPSQKTFQYRFDSAGRFQKTILPDAGVIDRTLDKNGNVTRVDGPAGATIARTYDAWNRLLSRTDGAGLTIRYAYTAESALETLTYSDGKAVTYTYDGAGRMETVTDWADRLTTYGYDPVGRVTSITAGTGAATALGYDDAGELLSVVNKTGANTISSVVYTLGSSGLRETADIVAACAPSSSPGQTTLTYNASNQALTFNGETLERDPNGSLTSLPGSGGTQTVAYDDCNRVQGVGVDIYTYDLEGHRIETVLGGVTRKYLIDAGSYRDPRINYPLFDKYNQAGLFVDTQGASTFLPGAGAPTSGQRRLITQPLDRCLEIRDGADAITHRLVYGLGLIAMDHAADGYRVFHYDSRGSTQALSDENGRVTDRYAYDTYGMLNTQSGNSDNPFLFNARDGVMDDGNGLLYMRSRHYAPAMFNFLQRDILFGDPFAPQSLDRYGFVRNNPIGFVDPLGFSGSRDAWKWGLGIGGGVAGLAGLGAAIYFLGPELLAGIGLGATTGTGGLGGGGLSGAARGLGNQIGRGIRRNLSGQSLRRFEEFGERLLARFNNGYQPLSQVEMTEFSGGASSLGSGGTQVTGFGGSLAADSEPLLGTSFEGGSLTSESTADYVDFETYEAMQDDVPTQQQMDFQPSQENTSTLRFRANASRGGFNASDF